MNSNNPLYKPKHIKQEWNLVDPINHSETYMVSLHNMLI